MGGSKDGTSQHTPPAGRYTYTSGAVLLDLECQAAERLLHPCHPLLDTPHVQMQTLGCPSTRSSNGTAGIREIRTGGKRRKVVGRLCMLLWRSTLGHKGGLLFSAPPLTADVEIKHLCVVLTYFFFLYTTEYEVPSNQQLDAQAWVHFFLPMPSSKARALHRQRPGNRVCPIGWD